MTADFDAGLFVPSILPLRSLCPLLLHARQECVSLHPGPNPLFEVPSPSFALLLLSVPSSVFLSVWPSYLSAALLPASCSCSEGHRHLHCPPLPRPHASAPGPDHTCHLHRTQGLSHGGFHPSLTSPFRASHPLIPARCHWGMAGAEGQARAGHRAAVVRMCVLSRARGNQRRWRVSEGEFWVLIRVIFLLFNDILLWPGCRIDWIEWMSVVRYMDLSVCACIITCWQWGWWLCLSDLWECAVKGLLSRILFPDWWLLTLSLCLCVCACVCESKKD